MKALEIENVNIETYKDQSEQENFRIPNETSCSSEFSEGCIFIE